MELFAFKSAFHSFQSNSYNYMQRVPNKHERNPTREKPCLSECYWFIPSFLYSSGECINVCATASCTCYPHKIEQSRGCFERNLSCAFCKLALIAHIAKTNTKASFSSCFFIVILKCDTHCRHMVLLIMNTRLTWNRLIFMEVLIITF